MSKIIWKALKLGPAVLSASLLVANSTLAAEKPTAHTNLDAKSAATNDQQVEQKEQANSAAKLHNVNPAPVAVNSTPANDKQINSDVEQAKPALVAGKKTLANKTPDLTNEQSKVKPVPVAGEKTLVNKTPDSREKSISPAQVAQNSEPALGSEEQTEPDSNPSNVDSADPMDQVTNVSQFSDVRPGDWAYEALRELVERYGCIAGYPDSTYRGNRAMTRYEFAAGVRACLNQIEKLIAASTTNFATKEDLEKLRRLTQEFQGELATLGTRVDKLEGRVGFLESHQFSTTTRLNAAIIFNVDEAFGNRVAVPSGAPRGRTKLSSNAVFSDRVRLNFDTSFTGKDRLRTRIEANNTNSVSGNVTGTNETRLAYDGITGAGRGNTVFIGKLQYRFPFTSSTTIFLDATGGEFYDNINTLNPFFESSDIGSISRFGRFNPIYRISNTGSATNTGAGATIVQKFGNALSVSAAYLARSAQDPVISRGLFDGTYAALGQVNFQPAKAFGLGLTYAHSYYAGNRTGAIFTGTQEVGVTGGTGSANANQPFRDNPTSTNAYSVEASFRLSQYFVISGWGGLDFSTLERSTGTGATRASKGQRATSYNYGVTLAFPDFGGKGNLLGLIFGQPPRATGNSTRLLNSANTTNSRRRDRDSAYHFEGQYRIRVTNNIYVTPGAIVILNPENNSKNPTEYVGVFRTTFTF